MIFDMRLKPEIADYFRKQAISLPTKAEVYLFGSRVSDTLKGGDIDILILSEHTVDPEKIRQIKVEFYKRFGLQKLDLVNFTFDEQHPFKALIIEDAIRL